MHSHYLELCVLTCGILQILTISLSKGSVCTSIHFPSYLSLTMMVPKYSNDSSSDLVACWPAAYNAPALPTIEALVGLSGAKGELPCGLRTRNLNSFGLAWPIANIQPIVSHKIQPMHLAGIELGLYLQVLERFVVCIYHNLFVDQVANAIFCMPV